MSSKLGLILSMFFVALTFLFGADLITIQSAYSSLESDASDIAYYLSQNGYYEKEFNTYFETYYGDKGITCEITDYDGTNYNGTIISFYVSRNLSLFLVSSSMDISVASTAVVGFY